MSRVPRRLAALVLLTGLVVAAAPPIASPRRWGPGAATAADNATITRVEKVTEQIRGLHAGRAVPVSMLDPLAFKRLVARDFDRDTTAADVRNAVQPLVLLGLLPAHADLRSILRAEQTDAVAAFYDPKVKRFFIPVRPGGLSLNDQDIIAHEYTHALQDQAFNLNRVRPDTEHQALHNSDQQLAQTALIEGDATAVMSIYAQTVFTQDQYLAFRREAQQAASAASKTDRTPRYLLDQLIFPYDAGVVFEEKLLHPTFSGASFADVDKAFRHPPVSTRQILHPETYVQNPTAPVPSLAPPRPALPAGWHRVDSDVLGEYELQDVLAQRLPAQQAAHAADGWRADRYALFDHGSDFLMVWRLRSGSVAAARTLAWVMVAYLSRRYGSQLAAPTAGRTLTYATPRSAAALRLSATDVLVALASRGALLPEVRSALGGLR